MSGVSSSSLTQRRRAAETSREVLDVLVKLRSLNERGETVVVNPVDAERLMPRLEIVESMLDEGESVLRFAFSSVPYSLVDALRRDATFDRHAYGTLVQSVRERRPLDAGAVDALDAVARAGERQVASFAPLF